MTDLRTHERESLRAFVQSAADEGYLSGRVLDYGCGKQPYRDIVEAAGGKYEGHDRAHYPANVSGEDIGIDDIWRMGQMFDVVLCTQVVQYVPDWHYRGMYPVSGVGEFVGDLHGSLVGGGHLVLTGPGNWPEIESEDLHRFTQAGIRRLLTEAGFEIIRLDSRGDVHVLGETLSIGWGAIAKA